MRISHFQESTSFSGSDVIAIEIDGVTYKLTGSTLATTLRTIGGALPVANGGTGATSAADARTALDVMGVDIPLTSDPVQLATGTVQVSSGGGFANYKYVDLYFSIQGGMTAAMRIRPNYAERRYKLGFFAWNDTDNKLRRVVLNFTTAGRYFTDIIVKMSYDGEAFADNSQILQLVKAVGYAW